MGINLRYRKKPIVIEAFQMTLERRWSNADWPQWLHDAWQSGVVRPSDGRPARGHESANELTIHTLEGDMRMALDEWIIRGVEKELYPCKLSIFEKLYEPADSAEDARETT